MQGSQLRSTVRVRKSTAQRSRGIFGAALTTAQLLDGLSEVHRSVLSGSGCDIVELTAFAALPLSLRKVASGVLVAISAPECMMSDASLAARQLRNTVVVSLLDTAQSVRSVLQDDMLFSEEVVEVDGHVYLPCSEVRLCVSHMQRFCGYTSAAHHCRSIDVASQHDCSLSGHHDRAADHFAAIC